VTSFDGDNIKLDPPPGPGPGPKPPSSHDANGFVVARPPRGDADPNPPPPGDPKRGALRLAARSGDRGARAVAGERGDDINVSTSTARMPPPTPRFGDGGRCLRTPPSGSGDAFSASFC
jgi:hypothetical protein